MSVEGILTWIVRESGLCVCFLRVCFCVLTVLERRYPKVVQDLYDAMRRFARVMGPLEHDKFIESHAREYCILFIFYLCCIVQKSYV